MIRKLLWTTFSRFLKEWAVFSAKITDFAGADTSGGVNLMSRVFCIKEKEDVVDFFREETLHGDGG